MIESTVGIVTAVRTTDKGTVIDILSMDGTFYTEVPLLNTPGTNETPVASDIPDRTTLIDPVTGELNLATMEEIMSSKVKTLVLFTVQTSKQNDVREVIPIKFFKNYAGASAGSPPVNMLRPDPGEVVLEAAGNGKIPGGYVHLKKNGDVLISTAGSASVEMKELEGSYQVEGQRFTMKIPPFTITIKDGALTITRMKYLGPSVQSPINDLTISVDAIGNFSVVTSPLGAPLAQLNIDQTGAIELKNPSGSVKLSELGMVTLNEGTGGIITTESICPFTGLPHIDGSLRCKASKF